MNPHEGIALSIERFRRAFHVGKIEERDCKVVWDVTERWCRMRCRLPSGVVVERIIRGNTEPARSGEVLLHDMSVWMWRAARRLKAGGAFADETCTELPPAVNESKGTPVPANDGDAPKPD